MIYDRDDRLVICNSQYRTIYEVTPGLTGPGSRFEDIIRTCAEHGLHPQAVGREQDWVAERLAQHRDPEDAVDQESPGDRRLQIGERRTLSGDTVGLRIDVTDLKRQQRRLQDLADALESSRSRAEHDALHDSLTDLPNRRHLDKRLVAIEADARRGEVLGLLHVDLDRFKQINDTLGHAARDAVLKSVAQTLREVVRDDDFVARIGGDAFVILCRRAKTKTKTKTSVKRIAGRLVEKHSKPIVIDGQSCRVSASIGVACVAGQRPADQCGSGAL